MRAQSAPELIVQKLPDAFAIQAKTCRLSGILCVILQAIVKVTRQEDHAG